MFEACTIRGHRLAPARFSAPLAGLTHSAFRRLLADFGGHGAVWTEMLAGPQVLHENFERSPWLKRSSRDPLVVYQLMVRQGDPLDRILDRLGEHGVQAVDLNLACDAYSIRSCEAGSALFENIDALQAVATTTRRHWPGLLLAKIRLGSRHPEWEDRLIRRLQVLSDAGIDALTVHPRFFEEKFRRRARLELLGWLGSVTRVPLIANGDIRGAVHLQPRTADLQHACGIMIGRMAVAQPWIFAGWDQPVAVDVAEVWHRLADYAQEDFAPALALRRLKMFTRYFAANFAFGHAFRVSIQKTLSLPHARAEAEAFFARDPVRIEDPWMAGI